MLSDEAVEAGVGEMLRFTMHRSLDGVRIFKDGERLEGPWSLREYDAAERALAAYQLRAAIEAAMPHLLASQGSGRRGCGSRDEPAVGATAALARTYKVGDFIGRAPVLCEHGHTDPNNLCPLCEGANA